MNANVRSRRTSFSVLNGREVFSTGVLRRWRCPVCAWWRDWSEQRCCGCGLARDIPAATPRVRAKTAAGSA